MLRVTARPALHGDRFAFDLAVYGGMGTTVVLPDGAETAAISDGYRRIRMDVEHGTLRQGPVNLTSTIDGLIGVDAKILTLRRLAALCRLGGFSRGLYPKERLAPRWILALRAHDAIRGGASQRELAMTLLGVTDIDAGWSRGANFHRLRVQRLLRNARSMVQGGYRTLLR